MSTSYRVVLTLIGIIAVYGTFQYWRTKQYIRIGNDLANKAVAYKQHPDKPTLRILMIGDSTVVGTGAERPEDSVAGRFGKDYPTAEIINLGVNGAKTREITSRLKQFEGQHFDLVLIHTGGNDIVRFSKLSEVEKSLREVLSEAKKLSDTVVALHGGNIGTAKLFPVGTRWILALRTWQARRIFLRVMEETGADYVDLWRRGKDDPFFANPDTYYAKDYFHPSGVGYKDWYEHIVAVLATTSFGKKNAQ